jgi:hypothetical protein
MPDVPRLALRLWPLPVECRDAAGHFVDTRYDVLVIE